MSVGTMSVCRAGRTGTRKQVIERYRRSQMVGVWGRRVLVSGLDVRNDAEPCRIHTSFQGKLRQIDITKQTTAILLPFDTASCSLQLHVKIFWYSYARSSSKSYLSRTLRHAAESGADKIWFAPLNSRHSPMRSSAVQKQNNDRKRRHG